MKIRILSAAAALVLLLGVVMLGREAAVIVLFLVALLGIHEFYDAVSKAGFKPIRLAGYLSCLFLLVSGLNIDKRWTWLTVQPFRQTECILLGVFAGVIILMSLMVFMHRRYNLNDISLTIFGILYVVFLFSFIVFTLNLNNGGYFVWLIFIGAWSTDTFAYFTGVCFGKTKILPEVSPKKSLEGMLGGMAGCILATVIYGLYLNSRISPVSMYHFIIIGALSGIISQVGDWTASAIKRYVKVKDYGTIMPGHGGVLDRFDSILFIAPVIYFYIVFITQQVS